MLVKLKDKGGRLRECPVLSKEAVKRIKDTPLGQKVWPNLQRKQPATLNSTDKKRKKLRKVMLLELTLTRSLNGVPKTHEEMKSYTFRSEAFTRILRDVNERLNVNISPNDKVKINKLKKQK